MLLYLEFSVHCCWKRWIRDPSGKYREKTFTEDFDVSANEVSIFINSD